MNFTREPIIETIITPREGFKLVIRNSKESGHEEYFVDSLEVVTFGSSCFFRSLERPKCFLLPVADYEILEVRETRMVIKNASIEKGIKIGGGREASIKSKEAAYDKDIDLPTPLLVDESKEEISPGEPRLEKRRERRRFRKRRLREDASSIDDLNEEEAEQHEGPFQEREGSHDTVSEWAAELADTEAEIPENISIPADGFTEKPEKPERKPAAIPSLLPPPTTLISETLSRYKDTPIFSGAFYEKAEATESASQPLIEESSVSLKESDEEEEDRLHLEEEESPEKNSGDLPF